MDNSISFFEQVSMDCAHAIFSFLPLNEVAHIQCVSKTLTKNLDPIRALHSPCVSLELSNVSTDTDRSRPRLLQRDVRCFLASPS